MGDLKMSIYMCIANRGALLLVAVVNFAVKGPTVSRISTIWSKTTVFDP